MRQRIYFTLEDTPVRMRENTDQNNSEYGHFLHSVSQVNLGRAKIAMKLHTTKNLKNGNFTGSFEVFHSDVTFLKVLGKYNVVSNGSFILKV